MSEFDTRMIDALAADGVKPFDLNEAFEKLHSLYGSRNKATETLRTQIMDLEKQMEAIKLCIKLVADGDIQRAMGEC